MFEKSDQDFLGLLDDPANLEKRIQQCGRTRLNGVIAGALMTVFIFGQVFWVLGIHQSSVSPGTPSGIQPPPGMVLLPLLFAILAVQQALRALAAHGELRTLLLFKKLRDDKSVVTP
jgi:hypothetical protein